jgi:hypothetical protein
LQHSHPITSLHIFPGDRPQPLISLLIKRQSTAASQRLAVPYGLQVKRTPC